MKVLGSGVRAKQGKGTQSISDGANISMRTGIRMSRRKTCPESSRWDQCLCIPMPEALSWVQRSPGWGGLAVLQESDSLSEIWDPSAPSSMAKAGKQWHKIQGNNASNPPE